MTEKKQDTLLNNIPWYGNQCIICLNETPLTAEHIIPACLGGILTVNFLCKPCNDFFGAKVDHTVCSDADIRQAAFELPNLSPERHKQINQKLNEGQRFILHTENGIVEGVAKGDTIMPVPTKSAAGNLVQPKRIAERTIREFLTKQGKSAKEIADAIGQHASAPEGQICEISENLDIKKWTVVNIGFNAGERVHPILLVKIAYEFLALHLGVAVYGEEPQLAEIRRTLLTLDMSNAFVEYFKREKKFAVHGMAFHGNNPHAQVQIRLFGSLAYRVNFPSLAVGGPRMAYTLDLAKNEHDAGVID